MKSMAFRKLCSGRYGCGRQILADCCFHHVLGPASSLEEAPAPAESMSTAAPPPARASACFTHQCLSIAKRFCSKFGPAPAPEEAPGSAERILRDAPAGEAAGSSGTRVAVKRLELDSAQDTGAGWLSIEDRAGPSA